MVYQGAIAGADFPKSARNYQYRRFEFVFDSKKLGDGRWTCDLKTVKAIGRIVKNSSHDELSSVQLGESCMRTAQINKRIDADNGLVFDACRFINKAIERAAPPALRSKVAH